MAVEMCRLGIRLVHLQNHVCTYSIAQHVSVAFNDGLVHLPACLIRHGCRVGGGGVKNRVDPRTNCGLRSVPSLTRQPLSAAPFVSCGPTRGWYHFSLAADCCTSVSVVSFLLKRYITVAMATRACPGRTTFRKHVVTYRNNVHALQQEKDFSITTQFKLIIVLNEIEIKTRNNTYMNRHFNALIC